ncbi:hypothetical protein WMY93_022430 [Mugilogobius chulae]|uniref:EF-hand domain-containing protein n=1 Tax=Mugilogobius chulae TaxID=88201 RepID=A0AAW0N838_9GOBI
MAEDPVAKLREKLLPQGAKSFVRIGRTFGRMANKQGKAHLMDFEEFVNGLNKFEVSMEEEEAKALFEIFDKDGSGTLNLNEFMVTLRPPMSEVRQMAVADAFERIDKDGNQEITIDDLKGIYNPKTHPKVISGQWSEEGAMKAFLSAFESPGEKDGVITLEELMNYYAGVIECGVRYTMR